MSLVVSVQGVGVQGESDRGLCVLGGKCAGNKELGGRIPWGKCPGVHLWGVLSCHPVGYQNLPCSMLLMDFSPMSNLRNNPYTCPLYHHAAC